jgi:hypothetical protein
VADSTGLIAYLALAMYREALRLLGTTVMHGVWVHVHVQLDMEGVSEAVVVHERTVIWVEDLMNISWTWI